jgi:WD40 repeat protein
VVTVLGKKALQVWDAQDGRKPRRLDVGIENIHDFSFSPDGKIIAAVGFQFEPEKPLAVHRVKFVDFATGSQFAKSEWDKQGDVWRLSCSPDSKTVAIAARGRPMQIKLANGRTRSDGSRADVTISCVDSESGHERREIVIPESYVNSLAFSPDGQLLAAGTSFDWELRSQMRSWLMGRYWE